MAVDSKKAQRRKAKRTLNDHPKILECLCCHGRASIPSDEDTRKLENGKMTQPRRIRKSIKVHGIEYFVCPKCEKEKRRPTKTKRTDRGFRLAGVGHIQPENQDMAYIVIYINDHDGERQDKIFVSYDVTVRDLLTTNVMVSRWLRRHRTTLEDVHIEVGGVKCDLDDRVITDLEIRIALRLD